MKITSIELKKDIDEFIIEKIRDYDYGYGKKPTTIVLSKPLLGWFKKVVFDKAIIPYHAQ